MEAKNNIKQSLGKVFRKRQPGEGIQDWLNSILDTIFEDYHKLVVAVMIGVASIAFIAVVGINHYGFIKDPAVCQMCHQTFYNPDDYVSRPYQEPMTGVTVGCAECHPYPFNEYKKSVHFTAVNGVRPGCVTCHGAPHDLWSFNKYMFLLGPSFWTKPGAAGISPGGVFYDMSSPMANQPKWETMRPGLAQRVREQYLANDSAPCRSCHNIENLISVENPEKPYVKDIHAAVKAEKKTCIQCHFNLVHAEVPWVEPGQKPVKQETATTGDNEGGKIYKDKCAACHGPDGNAAIPGVPSFAKGERLEKKDAELTASITNGVNAMPGFGGQLSAKQIEQAISYLRAMKK